MESVTYWGGLLPSVTLTEPKHTSWIHVGFKPPGNFITDNIARVTKVTLGPSKHYHMTSALLKNKTKKQVVISAVGEVGPGGSQIQDQPGVHRETLTQVSKPTNVKQCYVPPVTLKNWTVRPECFHRDWTGEFKCWSTSRRTLEVSAWTLLWWVWYPTARHGCKHRADGIRKAIVRSWHEIQSYCKLSPKLVP